MKQIDPEEVGQLIAIIFITLIVMMLIAIAIATMRKILNI